jgi:hypothetical protein
MRSGSSLLGEDWHDLHLGGRLQIHCVESVYEGINGSLFHAGIALARKRAAEPPSSCNATILTYVSSECNKCALG